MSTLRRISGVVFLAVLLAACTPEQSESLGQQPKKTLDRAQNNLDKAMQQGADRNKEADK